MTGIAGQQVLLVEDDPRLGAVLERVLGRRGHAVRLVRFGAEARAALAHDLPDILVLDINLPDETGWDVLRWLRARDGRQPRVVVLTAAWPPRERLAELAPDAVLTKPFPIEALERLIERGPVPAID